ncbi:MAG: hypothetical protein ACI9AF_001439 [Granulosicoccus sp.]|jgi:hypothetical protein
MVEGLGRGKGQCLVEVGLWISVGCFVDHSKNGTGSAKGVCGEEFGGAHCRGGFDGRRGGGFSEVFGFFGVRFF